MRVVEVSTGLSAKFLGRYLCDLGWHVSVWERPRRSTCEYGPTEWDTITSTLRRGKHVLDASSLHDALREADVVVEDGYEGGVIPDTLHVSLPCYASKDEEHRGFPHDEAAVMAASGVFSDMGLNRTLLGIRSSFSHLPLASAYGSMFGLCALLSEVVQGRTSSYVEVPLASSLVEALVHNSIVFPVDGNYLCRRKQRLRQAVRLPIDETELDTLFDPFFTFYDCEDGRKIYLVCPAHARHQLDALQTLGVREEVMATLPIVNTYKQRTTGIGSGNLSAEQSVRVRSILKRAFLQRPAEEWERRLGHAKVPAIMVRSTSEWCSLPHTRESGLVGEDGTTPCNVIWNHVLSQRDALKRESTDLSRVKVVDTTNVIAGPTISSVLARFGCEIIKVDSPSPSYSPDVTVVYGIPANIGKRSILVDVKTEEGRAVFHGLLQEADVLVVNTTSDGLQRMGVTYEDLLALNPRLVVTRFDAWGGPLEMGALTSFLGYDDNIQAATGIMVRYGGSHDTCEEHAHVGTIDTIAGVCGAASTLYALYRRDREGVVCEARTSLAAVSQFVQYPFLVSGEPPCVGGRGRQCMGSHPHYCVYKTKGGEHVVLTGGGEEVAHLRTYDDVAALFASHTLETLSTEYPSLRLTRLRTTEELRRRFAVHKMDLSLCHTYQYLECDDHPMGRTVIVSPVAMRVPVKWKTMVAPKYGDDTFRILRSLRMSHLQKRDHFSYCKGYIPHMPRCDTCGTDVPPLSVIGRCGHQMCDGCVQDTTGVKRCPCCGDESLELEGVWIQVCRRHYCRWRRGESRGSVTRSQNVMGVTSMGRCSSCPSSLAMFAR